MKITIKPSSIYDRLAYGIVAIAEIEDGDARAIVQKIRKQQRQEKKQARKERKQQRRVWRA